MQHLLCIHYQSFWNEECLVGVIRQVGPMVGWLCVSRCLHKLGQTEFPTAITQPLTEAL